MFLLQKTRQEHPHQIATGLKRHTNGVIYIYI